MKIDLTYLLNLDKRTDRLELVMPELVNFCKNTNMPLPNKISAVDGRQLYPDYEHAGRIGFNKSFEKIFQDAQKNDYQNIIVFEDDVEFIDNAGHLFNTAISQLPDDAEIIYLGANLRQPLRRITPNIYRITNAWTTHAVIYTRAAIDKILHHYKFPEYIVNSHDVFDEWLRVVGQMIMKCYIVSPMVAFQRKDFSDLTNDVADYSILKKNEKLFML